MSRINPPAFDCQMITGSIVTKSIKEMAEIIGVRRDRLGLDAGSLPFAPQDTTGGSESELQTVIIGNRRDVDLPCIIEQSNYFLNTVRRTESGDTSRKTVTGLEKYLSTGNGDVWENSWVRFPRHKLGCYAESIFQQDMLADKGNPSAGIRSDAGGFAFRKESAEYIRVPVSYLLKLALAEIIDPQSGVHPLIGETGGHILRFFLNDNTSPETSSFYVSSMKSEAGLGRIIAKETAIRFLLSQLLVMHADARYELTESGQKTRIFFSPHPPVRQKVLSNCISDAFYRELFMNPCLSGWDRGEEKHAYMHLCHRVLSRSQFNAVLKLREAGIISTNLVSLPNLSNISLANNGTHVSLGSIKLGGLMQDASSGFSAREEKYMGDLVVKIVEHFLPLFVGTYSAAPYRMDFSDFHPEKALGFLPHELDYTHLRMLWRRWRKKADLNIMGKSVTPFGPVWLDNMISKIFCLKGDFVPDFRLIDYLVALMSTDKNQALNGILGNSQYLKRDLADLGVFDVSMSLYLFEKLREFQAMGFSGFEGRHYSLFASFEEDMSPAVSLQNLLYLLAFKYILSGQISHEDIPDEPSIESERRQIIFGAAIGIPTFFVRHDTKNILIKKIIGRTGRMRQSRRYPGYIRIYNQEYRLALLKILHEDAADIIEMLGMRENLSELADRLLEPGKYSSWGRLTSGILRIAGAKSPFDLSAEKFNETAEKYYRTDLRKRHIREAFRLLGEDMSGLEREGGGLRQDMGILLKKVLGETGIKQFLERAEREIVTDKATAETVEKMIRVVLVHVHFKTELNRKFINWKEIRINHAA